MKKLILFILIAFFLISSSFSNEIIMIGGKRWEYIQNAQITTLNVTGIATIGTLSVGSIITPYTQEYHVDAGGGGDYTTILAALTFINADSVTKAAAGDYLLTNYVIKVSPGIYSDNLTFTNYKYLRVEGAGVIISGDIDITTTQQTGDYYSRLEFKGMEGTRAEKGPALTISGDIEATRNNDSLTYISFSGCYISGATNFDTDGTFVVQYKNSKVNGAMTTGTFATALSAVLIETTGWNRLAGDITGKFSFYNVDNAYISGDLTMTPVFDCKVTNSSFTGAVSIIATKNLTVDAISHKAIQARTPTLTGMTYVFLEGDMSYYDAASPPAFGGTVPAAAAFTSLSVASILVTGGIPGIGKVLTSDASGNMSLIFPDVQYLITSELDTGKRLAPDGAGGVAWDTGSGTGDIIGPASATDNAIVRFNTTTGTLVQDSAVIVNDTGEIQGSTESNYETYDMGFQSYMILTDPKLIFGWLNCPSAEIDLSENKFVGTYNGTMTSADQLFQGKVFSLDLSFSNDYVSVPDNDDFSFGNGSADQAFTFIGWVKMGPFHPSRTIISKWDITTGFEKREYLVELRYGQVAITFFDESTDGYLKAKNTVALADGWHFVVVTYSGNSLFSGINIYLNDVNVALTDSSSGTYAAMENSTSPLWIGGYTGTGGTAVETYTNEMSMIILDKEEIDIYDIHKLYLLGKAKGF